MQLYLQITVSVMLVIAGLIVLAAGVRWLSSGTLTKRLIQYVAGPLEFTHTRANAPLIQPG